MRGYFKDPWDPLELGYADEPWIRIAVHFPILGEANHFTPLDFLIDPATPRTSIGFEQAEKAGITTAHHAQAPDAGLFGEELFGTQGAQFDVVFSFPEWAYLMKGKLNVHCLVPEGFPPVSLLGRDVLRHFRLVVDHQGREILLDRKTVLG